MRRYARELNFTIPAEEEAEVWRLFQEQTPEMRLDMLECYDRAGMGDSYVKEEAVCRLP
jgi:hypothetical protein